MKKVKFYLKDGSPFCLEPGKPLEVEVDDKIAKAVSTTINFLFANVLEQKEQDGVMSLTFKESVEDPASFQKLFNLLGVEVPSKVERSKDAFVPASNLDPDFVETFNLDSSASYPTYVYEFQSWWQSATSMLSLQGHPNPEFQAAAVVKNLPQYSSPEGKKVKIEDLRIVIEDCIE